MITIADKTTNTDYHKIFRIGTKRQRDDKTNDKIMLAAIWLFILHFFPFYTNLGYFHTNKLVFFFHTILPTLMLILEQQQQHYYNFCSIFCSQK